MNRSRKEALKERLDKLDANEHAQIFNIIKKYTESFTKTQNGVLVSSDSLPDECMIEMEKMVLFYLDQHKRMEADDVERKTYERRTS
jgi:hypothetical protein